MRSWRRFSWLSLIEFCEEIIAHPRSPPIGPQPGGDGERRHRAPGAGGRGRRALSHDSACNGRGPTRLVAHDAGDIYPRGDCCRRRARRPALPFTPPAIPDLPLPAANPEGVTSLIALAAGRRGMMVHPPPRPWSRGGQDRAHPDRVPMPAPPAATRRSISYIAS